MKLLVNRFGRDSIKRKKTNWKKYFDNLSSKNLIESHITNGFLDKKLVSKIRKTVRNVIEKNKFKNIYDCGCGDGSVTSKLLNKKRNIIGIDFSANMCQKAEKKGLLTFQLDIKDLCVISLTDLIKNESIIESREDCLVFCESLGCLDNPLDIVEGILKKNQNLNSILLSFPNSQSIIRKIVNYMHSNSVNYFELAPLKERLYHNSYRISDLTFIIGIPFIYLIDIKIKIKNDFFSKIINFIANYLGLNIIVLFKKYPTNIKL